MPKTNYFIACNFPLEYSETVFEALAKEYPETVFFSSEVEAVGSTVLRPRRRAINIFIFPKHKTKIFILRLKELTNNETDYCYWPAPDDLI